MIEVNYLAGNEKPPTEIYGMTRYQVEIHKRLKDKVKLNWISYNPTMFWRPIAPVLNGLKYLFIVRNSLNPELVTHIPIPRYSYLLSMLDIK
jgi:hypothetical protein